MLRFAVLLTIVAVALAMPYPQDSGAAVDPAGVAAPDGAEGEKKVDERFFLGLFRPHHHHHHYRPYGGSYYGAYRPYYGGGYYGGLGWREGQKQEGAAPAAPAAVDGAASNVVAAPSPPADSPATADGEIKF